MLQGYLYSNILVTSLWRVILASISSQTDMPSLTTVTLNKYYAFQCKKTVHTKSISFSSPSFLDISPVLKRYLQLIVSFTLDFTSILSKGVIHTSCKQTFTENLRGYKQTCLLNHGRLPSRVVTLPMLYA